MPDHNINFIFTLIFCYLFTTFKSKFCFVFLLFCIVTVLVYSPTIIIRGLESGKLPIPEYKLSIVSLMKCYWWIQHLSNEYYLIMILQYY